MKNLPYVFIFVSCFFISHVSAQQVRYVAAPSGLMLREKPGTDQKSLVKVPYGTRLNILSYTSASSTIDGYEGTWLETSYEDKKGFIFSGYLLPVLPPLGHTKLTEYFANAFGKPVYTDSCKNSDDDYGTGVYTYTHRYLYKNGEVYLRAEIYEGGENTLLGISMSLQEAYLWMYLVTKYLLSAEDSPEYNTTLPLYGRASFPKKEIKNDSLQVKTIGDHDMDMLQVHRTWESFSYIKFFYNNGAITVIWGSHI